MIQVTNLTKQYGDHTAVSDLSFHIEKGQIYGFLGPNGAGKSTTMNIMTGCLAATSGDVKVGGYDIFEQGEMAKKLIGYLPEQPPLYLDRTPEEYLTFVARAKGVHKSKIAKQVSSAMDVTQITDVKHRLCKNLSKGYKQRVGIAQALLGNPEVVILDEPTVGLDPRQIIEIRDLIKALGEKHTVILSSHILSEVQAVCQTILIISKGRLVAHDTSENLEKRFAGTTTVQVVAESPKEKIDTILKPLSFITNLDIQETENGKCRCSLETTQTDSDAVCRDIFFAFSHAKAPILQMQTMKASLEDIFLELTNGADTDSADVEEVSGQAAESEVTEE